jgi:small subunit ribosomal protein S2
MSALPKFTMRELLDAGVHFGHKTMRWNPKMGPFIFGERNKVHILDLQQTVPLLYRAMQALHEVSARNGRVLFVGTKRQASDLVAEAAERSGQYYVNHRWLGGMLTNWNTVSKSIKTMRDHETTLASPEAMATRSKKELLQITRQKQKLELSLGGIKDMGGEPDILFVIDTNKEALAVEEARRLGIPVVAVVDSNSNPDGIDYPIPGNDDAARAIRLYCQLASDAILSGIEQSLAKSGKDVGASVNPPKEAAAKKAPAKKEEAKADEKKEAKPAAKKAAAKKTDAKADEKKEAKPAAKKADAKKEDAKADADTAEVKKAAASS